VEAGLAVKHCCVAAAAVLPKAKTQNQTWVRDCHRWQPTVEAEEVRQTEKVEEAAIHAVDERQSVAHHLLQVEGVSSTAHLQRAEASDAAVPRTAHQVQLTQEGREPVAEVPVAAKPPVDQEEEP
jgi:hypothetical protein